jgi:hypothetical protein
MTWLEQLERLGMRAGRDLAHIPDHRALRIKIGPIASKQPLGPFNAR